MAVTANKSGVIADVNSTINSTGMLTHAGVGIGTTQAGPVQGFTLATDTTSAITAIGGAAIPIEAVDASGVLGKNLKYLQTTGPVAIDAVVATGWVNKTGRALITGEFVWAQEA